MWNNHVEMKIFTREISQSWAGFPLFIFEIKWNFQLQKILLLLLRLLDTMKLIFSPSRSPSFNLAAEEFLFSESGDEIVFLYVNDPCVIIGSNQSVPNEVDQHFCVPNSIEIIRRLSGGGAVYHDQGNINYCFIHNKISGKSSLSADFLLPVILSLHSMQIPCEIGKRKDLWLNGYKISGTASHVSKNRELHHGTLLYNTDLGNRRN